MKRNIENPFKDQWDEFDEDEFKETINDLIEELIDADDKEERYDILEELDKEFGQLSMMLKYKDQETIEAMPVSSLPKDIIDAFGLDEYGDNAYIPIAMLLELFGVDTLEGFEELVEEDFEETEDKKDKNDWLL